MLFNKEFEIFIPYMPYIQLTLDKIVFDPLVQTFCNNSKFRCPNYGHSWGCPPEAPYLEKELAKYEKFFLIYYEFNLNNYITKVQERHPRRSKQKILRSFYRKTYMRDHLEKEVYKFLEEFNGHYDDELILWDGPCRLCYKENLRCTHDETKPCRYEPRYSMEAVGINVDKTVKNVNLEMEWPPTHHAYRFGLICFK